MEIGKLPVKPPLSHAPKTTTGSILIPITMKSVLDCDAIVLRVYGHLNRLAPKTNRGDEDKI